MRRIPFILICFLLCMWIPGLANTADDTAYGQENKPQARPHPPISFSFEPVEKALENAPITISIHLAGILPEDKVILNFRDMGRLDFNTLPMGLNPETKLYETTIDERYHSDETIEYYIEILPSSGLPVRIPKGDKLYKIKSYSDMDKYIRMAWIVLLVISPMLFYHLGRRIYKSHVKQTTLYQQKLRKRRRELKKEREKHYKDYLRKLSGGPVKGKRNPPAAGVTKRSPGKPERKPKRKPAARAATGSGSGARSAPDDKVSTQELKRELDQILNRGTTPTDSRVKRAQRPTPTRRSARPAVRRAGTSATGETQRKPSTKRAAATPRKPRDAKTTPPAARKPGTGKASPRPVRKRTRDQTTPPTGRKPDTARKIPSGTATKSGPKHKIVPQNIKQPLPEADTDTDKLNTEELDKLLDILGLDL